MRPLLICIATLLSICSCKQSRPGAADTSEEALMDSVYYVNGFVTGAADKSMVILSFPNLEKKSDTTYIAGEAFNFKGSVAEPLMATISMPDTSYKGSLNIILENATITIEANKDSLHKALVAGGWENARLSSLKKVTKIYEDQLSDIINQSALPDTTAADSASQKKLDSSYIKTQAELLTTLKQYVIEYPTSVAAAYYVFNNYQYAPDEKSLDTIYNAFDSTFKQSVYAKKINDLLVVAKRTAIGQPAPDFTLTTENKKVITPATYKGKYVLIDFWASWCNPCRQENPNIVKAYKQYKPKGFTVLGIAVDDKQSDLKKAILQDKLTWTNVNDLNSEEGSAAKSYGVNSIPQNFLLDTAGVIIAKGLRGQALDQTLSKIFPADSTVKKPVK